MDMSGSYKRDKNLSLLISMPNVIITAHQAFFTSEALNKIASDGWLLLWSKLNLKNIARKQF